MSNQKKNWIPSLSDIIKNLFHNFLFKVVILAAGLVYFLTKELFLSSFFNILLIEVRYVKLIYLIIILIVLIWLIVFLIQSKSKKWFGYIKYSGFYWKYDKSNLQVLNKAYCIKDKYELCFFDEGVYGQTIYECPKCKKGYKLPETEFNRLHTEVQSIVTRENE